MMASMITLSLLTGPFLSVIMKNQVYHTSVSSLRQPKQKSIAIRNISHEPPKKLWINTENQIHACIQELGGHK